MSKHLIAAAAALLAVPAAADLMKPAGPVFVRGTVIVVAAAPLPVVRDAVTTLSPAEMTVKAASGATVVILRPAGFKVFVF